MNVFTRMMLPVSIIILMSGCNTYSNKSFQEISVHTPGVENVECILKTDRNKYVMIAPGTITVNRADTDMEIICEKANYKSALKNIKSGSSVKNVYLNITNGFVPGLLYDVATNSVYEYPKTVIMKMKKKKFPVEAYVSDNRYVIKKKKIYQSLAEKSRESRRAKKVEEIESKIKTEEVMIDSLIK